MSLLQSTEMDSGPTHSLIFYSLGNLLLGVMQLVCEANNSPLSRAEVNNQTSNSICSHAFTACTGTTSFNLPCKFNIEVMETFPSTGKFHCNPDSTFHMLHSTYEYQPYFKNIRTPIESNYKQVCMSINSYLYNPIVKTT